MTELILETTRRDEMIDITSRINAKLPRRSGSGICLVFCPHTTAGITINENCDPDVRHDLLAKLDKLAPHTESFYRHSEGNSAAHLKATLVGFSQTIPYRDGAL
ncbi:MAG: secondary thiamine-phosphate synthase enzyme YjbQ, partial [Victivallaceae bacterium]|nr:secondary thiamine-phosphate synthase enzyme YjbQ [Victivallaceae bacterium]